MYRRIPDLTPSAAEIVRWSFDAGVNKTLWYMVRVCGLPHHQSEWSLIDRAALWATMEPIIIKAKREKGTT